MQSFKLFYNCIVLIMVFGIADNYIIRASQRYQMAQFCRKRQKSRLSVFGRVYAHRISSQRFVNVNFASLAYICISERKSLADAKAQQAK